MKFPRTSRLRLIAAAAALCLCIPQDGASAEPEKDSTKATTADADASAKSKAQTGGESQAETSKAGSEEAGGSAKQPQPAAKKLDTKALVKALEAFLVMLDNGQYDESFDAGAASLREGLTKENWASNLKANRASLGKPTDRNAKKADTKTDLTNGKRTYVVPVASVFEKGAVTEEVTLVQEDDGEFRVADYSISTRR